MKWYRRKGTVFFLMAALLAVQMAGCRKNNDGESAEETVRQESSSETAGESASDEKDTEQSQIITVNMGEGGEKSIEFAEEDWDADWDADTVTGLVLTEDGITAVGSGVDVSGSSAVIRKGGTYVVSGILEDGQIRIEAGDNELVHLVLNGVELSNPNTAPIYGADKTKVVLTLEKGTRNIIRDGDAYIHGEGAEAGPDKTEGLDEPEAPIFLNGDLTINGEGMLEVQGNYQSGIRSGGELKVISGMLMIDAQHDGLKGKDAVIIWGGDLTIRSVKDGIKSDNNEDTEKGFIWIENGTIRIAAQEDGIQAETALIVNGGNIDITESEEGLAGKTVDILGGVIRAVTRDDGINSAASVNTEREKMMDQEGVYTRIAGGEIWLNTLADGIDSNGDFYMEGGSLYLTGPDSGADGILDYNGQAKITDGVVFAAGNSSMMQTFGEASTQPVLVVYYSEFQSEGSEIRLTDADGREIGKFSPERSFNAVIISCPELEEGNTYRVVVGENTAELTVEGLETVSGEAPEENGEGGIGRLEGQEHSDGPDYPGKMEGRERPEGMERSEGQGRPEGMERPNGQEHLEETE